METIEKLSPVRLLVNPDLSRNKKDILRDCDKVLGELGKIEVEFLEQLFDENDYSYHDLFVHYLNEYTTLLRRLERTKKLKVVVLNTTYFYELFHPMEKAY